MGITSLAALILLKLPLSLLVRRPPRGQRKFVLPREVKMLAIAVVALLVLGTLAEAASVKYDYPTRGIYKQDSYEPSHESHYENQDYSHRPHHDSYDEAHYGRDVYSVEPSYTPSMKSSPAYKQTHEPRYRYDHKPSYNSHKYKRSVYGYGGDSYGKSYGGDSYGKSYSSYKPSSYRHKYRKAHEPRSYRQKRSMEEREEQIILGAGGGPSFVLSFPGGEVKEVREEQIILGAGGSSGWVLSFPGGEVKEAREEQIILGAGGGPSFVLSFPGGEVEEAREEQIILGGGRHSVVLSFLGDVEDANKRSKDEREEQIILGAGGGHPSVVLSFLGGEVEDANPGRSREMSGEVKDASLQEEM